MRVMGIARIAQIVALSAAAFALTGCVYHYDDSARGGRHHRGDVGQSYGGAPGGHYGGYYGRDYQKSGDHSKRPRHDSNDSRQAYDGDRKRYDSDRNDYRDRGYGAHSGHGAHRGYGAHRSGSVCDSDGDRCYGSSQPYWNYREYYRRHGYRWQND